MEHSIQSTQGIQVDVSDTGASILRVRICDRRGYFQNVALAPQHLHSVPSQVAYAGATLGPVAGRIASGSLQLQGRPVQLPTNEGRHHLHGGAAGLSDLRWKCEGASDNEALFRCERTEAEDGYPGLRRFAVRYSLRGDRLRITLTAETDAPTAINLSNHVYWNLSGDFSHDLSDHDLWIDSNAVWYNDSEHLPVHLAPVVGTVFDYRTEKRMADGLQSCEPQLRIAYGYNHCYRLKGCLEQPAARLTHRATGRQLELYTDAPAMVMYSGGYLDMLTEEGAHARAGCALALEPQEMPVLRGDYPAVTADQDFSRTIEYRFQTVTPV